MFLILSYLMLKAVEPFWSRKSTLFFSVSKDSVPLTAGAAFFCPADVACMYSEWSNLFEAGCISFPKAVEQAIAKAPRSAIILFMEGLLFAGSHRYDGWNSRPEVASQLLGNSTLASETPYSGNRSITRHHWY